MGINMALIKISSDLSTGIKSPQYVVRELSRSQFKIFHVYDTISSLLTEKYTGCIVNPLPPSPLKMQIQYKASYMPFYVGDQDGFFDPLCTQFIITKLTLSVTFDEIFFTDVERIT